jgi:hypothetical protein
MRAVIRDEFAKTNKIGLFIYLFGLLFCIKIKL